MWRPIAQRVYRGLLDDPKTERGKRQAALPPDLAGEVDNWRNISPDTGPDALVFPSERGTYLSRDNFLRRNIQKKLEEIGLGWVNFQVLRRTQASLGHKEGVDPKVAADQRGHAIGVAIDTYTKGDLESRRDEVTKLELALAGRGRVGGNVLDFVAAMEQCSVRDAAIKLQIWFLVPAAGESLAPVGKEPHVEISAGKEPEPNIAPEKTNGVGESESNKPLTFTLQNIDGTHPYLTERGLTEDIAQTFGVGFFAGKGSMHGRIVIPVHNPEGELVAYARRSIDGSEPRYKFPAGFHKSLELFNLHRVKGEVSIVLVEGFFDCMKVTQAGFPCVALMGTSMSKAQEKLIGEYFGHVVVMLDGDEAGRDAAAGIADRLQRIVYQVQLVDLPQGVQPDNISDDELHRMLDWVPSSQ